MLATVYTSRVGTPACSESLEIMGMLGAYCEICNFLYSCHKVQFCPKGHHMTERHSDSVPESAFDMRRRAASPVSSHNRSYNPSVSRVVTNVGTSQENVDTYQEDVAGDITSSAARVSKKPRLNTPGIRQRSNAEESNSNARDIPLESRPMSVVTAEDSSNSSELIWCFMHHRVREPLVCGPNCLPDTRLPHLDEMRVVFPMSMHEFDIDKWLTSESEATDWWQSVQSFFLVADEINLYSQIAVMRDNSLQAIESYLSLNLPARVVDSWKAFVTKANIISENTIMKISQQVLMQGVIELGKSFGYEHLKVPHNVDALSLGQATVRHIVESNNVGSQPFRNDHETYCRATMNSIMTQLVRETNDLRRDVMIYFDRNPFLHYHRDIEAAFMLPIDMILQERKPFDTSVDVYIYVQQIKWDSRFAWPNMLTWALDIDFRVFGQRSKLRPDIFALQRHSNSTFRMKLEKAWDRDMQQNALNRLRWTCMRCGAKGGASDDSHFPCPGLTSGG